MVTGMVTVWPHAYIVTVWLLVWILYGLVTGIVISMVTGMVSIVQRINKSVFLDQKLRPAKVE